MAESEPPRKKGPKRRDWGHAQLARLSHASVAPVIERNVQAIAENRRKNDAERTFQQRLADAVTGFAGSMTFVWLHLAWFALWIIVNLAVVSFDPGFALLTMVVSLEAIFLSVFILVSQKRQGELVDRHAELDLQINLLSEHETTRILTLLTDVAGKLGVKPDDPQMEELEEDVAPEEVLERIEEDHKTTAEQT